MTTKNQTNDISPVASDPFSQMVRTACEDAIKGILKHPDFSSRRLLSIEETAIYLNICEREVYNLLSSKQLTSVRHGRRQMLDLRDLDAWIEARKAA